MKGLTADTREHSPLILVALNEINFAFVEYYAKLGRLPVMARLMRDHGVATTTSEIAHENLEPWIQWVTAHTGLSFNEHGVFRLGDIVERDFPQIWDQLEKEGVTVGAISPMNAKNRTHSAKFFVPDPWTHTQVTGSWLIHHLHRAISKAVNRNAEARFPFQELIRLAAGYAIFSRGVNFTRYLRMFTHARARPWLRALLLDLLLSDIFIRLTRTRRPEFASLFVNAGAHVQHHYLFSAAAYAGEMRNPEWYVSPQMDPLLEAYDVYDAIIGQIRQALPMYRMMIATGLHQDPHDEVTFYWRLRDHEQFLRKLGIPFLSVAPRMSRDFVVVCESEFQANMAARMLSSIKAYDGIELFEVDNRGSNLFVMLTYPREISKDFSYRLGDQQFEELRRDVVFVAIKNGKHNGVGYFLDTGLTAGRTPTSFPLKQLPDRVRNAVLG